MVKVRYVGGESLDLHRALPESGLKVFFAGQVYDVPEGDAKILLTDEGVFEMVGTESQAPTVGEQRALERAARLRERGTAGRADTDTNKDEEN